MAGKTKRPKPYRLTDEKKSVRARELGAVGALLWLAGAAAWLYAAVSLVGFDLADPPGQAAWPVNDPPANWGGAVGAHLAYWALRLVGWAALVPMAFGLAWLVLTARRCVVPHPLVRALGVALTTGAVAALACVFWPMASSPLPGLAGGTVGLVTAEALVPGLAIGGSVLLLGLMALVGMVVAADKLMLAAPAAAWRVLVPAAQKSRQAATLAGGATRAGAGGLLSGLGGMMRRTKKVTIRLNDVDEPVEVVQHAAGTRRKNAGVPAQAEAKPIGKKKPVRRVELEPAEVDELEDAAVAVADDVAEADTDTDIDAHDEHEDGAVGAPQVFDRDALKEKIAKLPVRFAAANKSTATAEDLASIQNLDAMESYRFPTLDLLEEPEEGFNVKLETLVRDQAEALEAALKQYKVEAEVVDIESGPAITLYHLRLAPGTKVAAVQAVSSDVARALKAVNIRVVSNMEGRDTVGVEVPNPTKERVRLKELMGNRDLFAKMKLPMFLGKDAAGDPLIADLTRMPHMLIAGTTGSGKSVCMNTIIMSFLYTKKPNELKLVLVDPKMVEMSQFKDIPHLMCPVVTEMSKAAAILEWAVTKMDERYELLADAGCRDIASYNSLEFDELCERLAPPGTDGLSDDEKARIPRKLPYMVFIIDELADLMMTHKEVEGSIIRIAQKARAVGIHLILATQRPQANVVTGLIKSNMPCRVTFKVASGMDSRIVLDSKGGELLLGQGDMLFLNPNNHKLMRAQGTLVDDLEIRKVVKFLKEVAAPSFEHQLVQLRGPAGSDDERLFQSENHSSASLAAAQEDPMFDRAVEIVLETKRGSVSLLQRRLAIGYTRASRLIDLMGIAGIISDHKGSVARDVLISPEEWEAIKALANEEAERLGIAPGAHKDDPEQQVLFRTGTVTRPAVADEDGDDDGAEAPPFATANATADSATAEDAATDDAESATEDTAEETGEDDTGDEETDTEETGTEDTGTEDSATEDTAEGETAEDSAEEDTEEEAEEEDGEEEDAEEETGDEDTADEATEEDAAEDETTEDAATEDEATEDDSTEDGESGTEDTGTEDTGTDDSGTEDTAEGESTEEGATEEGSAEEDGAEEDGEDEPAPAKNRRRGSAA